MMKPPCAGTAGASTLSGIGYERTFSGPSTSVRFTLNFGQARPGGPAQGPADLGSRDLGRAVWLRIVKAVEELQSEERPEDAEVH